MGWDFTYGASRNDVIRELTKDKPGEKHVAVGNHLWVVWDGYFRDGSHEGKTACLYLLANNKVGWGYKDIHEEMGPHYVTCPKSLFKLLGPPCGEWSAQWRQRQAQEYSRADWLKRMRPGDLFASERSGTVFERGREQFYRKFPRGCVVSYEAHNEDRKGAWAIRKRDAVPVPVYREV